MPTLPRERENMVVLWAELCHDLKELASFNSIPALPREEENRVMRRGGALGRGVRWFKGDACAIKEPPSPSVSCQSVSACLALIIAWSLARHAALVSSHIFLYIREQHKPLAIEWVYLSLTLYASFSLRWSHPAIIFSLCADIFSISFLNKKS